MKMCYKLHKIIKLSFTPTMILAISRGGAIIGSILSNLFKCDMAVISCKAYKGKEKLDKVYSNNKIAFFREFKNNEDILIVDSICDTGKTLEYVMKLVRRRFSNCGIATATLFNVDCWKDCEPFFYVEKTKNWILFPWEVKIKNK